MALGGMSFFSGVGWPALEGWYWTQVPDRT